MKSSVFLLDRSFFQLCGPDAERYLNGQVTQQVAGLTVGETVYSFICDIKGRVEFELYITRIEGGFLINAEPEVREALFVRLDRYLIADDCELKDVTGDWALRHTLGSVSENDVKSVSRFGCDGMDELLTGEALAELSPEDSSHSEELEHLRISRGIARSPDLIGALPAETRLEERAVSFHKGCYQGQEVISRMKRAGKTNRALVKSKINDISDVSSLPIEFFDPNTRKPVFTLTSISPIQDGSGGRFGIGYLSTRANQNAEFLTEGGMKASEFEPILGS